MNAWAPHDVIAVRAPCSAFIRTQHQLAGRAPGLEVLVRPGRVREAVPMADPDLQRTVRDPCEEVGDTALQIAPARVVFVSALPKTRSAKIVRRAVRATALGGDPGDLSTLENPESLGEIANASR